MRSLLFRCCVVLSLLALTVRGVEAQCWRQVTSNNCFELYKCYWAAAHPSCLPWCMYCVNWGDTSYKMDDDGTYWRMWKANSVHIGGGELGLYQNPMPAKPSMVLSPKQLEDKFRMSFLAEMGAAPNGAPRPVAESVGVQTKLNFTSSNGGGSRTLAGFRDWVVIVAYGELAFDSFVANKALTEKADEVIQKLKDSTGAPSFPCIIIARLAAPRGPVPLGADCTPFYQEAKDHNSGSHLFVRPTPLTCSSTLGEFLCCPT
jgi:hypothetical protein